MGYISKNRYKFYLKCHLIFVCSLVKRILILLESTSRIKVDAIHPINWRL